MITYEVTILDDGTKEWRLNGQRHREDGPAVEYADGSKFWFKNGQCHREDGPAIERANGDKYWYLNSKKYTEAEFKAKMAKPSCEGKTVTIDGVKYKLSKA